MGDHHRRFTAADHSAHSPPAAAPPRLRSSFIVLRSPSPGPPKTSFSSPFCSTPSPTPATRTTSARCAPCTRSRINPARSGHETDTKRARKRHGSGMVFTCLKTSTTCPTHTYAAKKKCFLNTPHTARNAGFFIRAIRGPTSSYVSLRGKTRNTHSPPISSVSSVAEQWSPLTQFDKTNPSSCPPSCLGAFVVAVHPPRRNEATTPTHLTRRYKCYATWRSQKRTSPANPRATPACRALPSLSLTPKRTPPSCPPDDCLRPAELRECTP
jgi:hypothetical protein